MKSITKRRVAVTGLGAVTDVGADAATTWQSMVEGRSGIDVIAAFEQTDQWGVRIAGEVREWDPTGTIDARELKRIDRFCALGMCAAAEAARDCGLDFTQGDPYRRGVVIGSGIGGILTIEIGHTKLLKTGPRKMSPFIVLN